MPLPDGGFDALNQIAHGFMLGGSAPLTSGIGQRLRLTFCRKKNASHRKQPMIEALRLGLHELEGRAAGHLPERSSDEAPQLYSARLTTLALM